MRSDINVDRCSKMEIKIITTKRVLSPTQMTLAPYSINPYRGCEFNCVYCYAKMTKQYQNNVLGIKLNAPFVLEQELRRRDIKKVLLGSNCECFTYVELKFRIMEKILKILNKFKVTYTILTKSHLIKHYLHLVRINPDNRVFFTFNFSSEQLKSHLEESSPTLEERIFTLRKIENSKIPLRIHIGPYIPYVTEARKIFPIFSKLVKEVNIELYHSKMGNFANLLTKIRSFDQSLAFRIENVYRDRTSYTNFSNELKKNILNLNETYKFKLFFIIPEFDSFYDSRMSYV